jgi:hypothetical protein
VHEDRSVRLCHSLTRSNSFQPAFEEPPIHNGSPHPEEAALLRGRLEGWPRAHSSVATHGPPSSFETRSSMSKTTS